MTQAQILIQDSIYDIGQGDPNQSIPSGALTHGLRTLNRMIGQWSTQGLLIPYSTTENFNTTSSVSYTMGSGGTASTTRANRITNAYIRDSNSLDSPLPVKDQVAYNALSNKSLSGRPNILFYDPVFPVGVIYLDRVPDGTYTIYIESNKNLHSTLELATEISLPIEYELAIVSNLSLLLAPSYGVSLSPLQVRTADDSLRNIKNQNSGNRQYEMNMPAGVGGRGNPYNINEG